MYVHIYIYVCTYVGIVYVRLLESVFQYAGIRWSLYMCTWYCMTNAWLHRTKVVKDNGFNPQWNVSFKFKSIFPDLAILLFVVMDDDTLSDDFIGQYSLPLESLAPGQCVCVCVLCESVSVCV